MLLGEGGTGKSRAIKSFLKFARLIGASNKVVVSGTTHLAGALLRGGTYLGAVQMDVQGRTSRTPLNDVRDAWSPVLIHIIDEVSMMGAGALFHYDQRLRQIKQRDEPFGGLTVVLVGDFMQLRAVNQISLFTDPLAPRKKPLPHEALQGLTLFEKFLNEAALFLLTKNYRLLADPQFREWIAQFRLGNVAPDTPTNINRECQRGPAQSRATHHVTDTNKLRVHIRANLFLERCRNT
jgi:hypothetical protein